MLRKPVPPLPVAASTSFAKAECGAAVNSTFLLCPNDLAGGGSECGYRGCRWKQPDPTATHRDTSVRLTLHHQRAKEPELSGLECGMVGAWAR